MIETHLTPRAFLILRYRLINHPTGVYNWQGPMMVEHIRENGPPEYWYTDNNDLVALEWWRSGAIEHRVTDSNALAILEDVVSAAVALKFARLCPKCKAITDAALEGKTLHI